MMSYNIFNLNKLIQIMPCGVFVTAELQGSMVGKWTNIKTNIKTTLGKRIFPIYIY